jgi:hypothetical protein
MILRAFVLVGILAYTSMEQTLSSCPRMQWMVCISFLLSGVLTLQKVLFHNNPCSKSLYLRELNLFMNQSPSSISMITSPQRHVSGC